MCNTFLLGCCPYCIKWVKLSGWNGERPLIDSMCGSGTILAEALMNYCWIPAGYLSEESGLKFFPDYCDKTLQ